MTNRKGISITTKATAEQYEKYVAAANGKPLSEWMRERLDHAVEREPFECELLKRIDLLERCVLNVGADLSAQVPITRERLRQYRDDARVTPAVVPPAHSNGTADEPKWWDESNRVPMFRHQIPGAKRDGTT